MDPPDEHSEADLIWVAKKLGLGESCVVHHMQEPVDDARRDEAREALRAAGFEV